MYHQDHQDHHTADQVRSTTASHRPHTRLAIACVTVTATAALLSGCGGDSSEKTSDTSAGATASVSPSEDMTGMDDMADMAMGDPSATPADKIPDADVVKGTFKLLDTRPPGMDNAKGSAWLAQGPKGTTVTVSLTGLEPGDTYMAHLHAQQCSTENGGEHFQFDKGGPTTPPNEVHLMFTADKSGMGMTTVNNTRKTNKGAVAIVVHPAKAQDNRIACAEFAF
ncbi:MULTISPECIES: superoxide dismutase family protein [Streptomyces]|uniref:superoxide dismutase n=1 Tax=Streptomyces TaxID=1883 RepID=UPI000A3CB966|nr:MULTISPECIES: superoxide dismutase [Streptomyces]MDX2553288.1 superoxide dismutase family protein [Streptomyces stelliscabiei]MDX2612324.1 superoxide dismutase family protein [Streptomyces stelliscabiei]MDX2637802.1 superoxide dismutase family protein [Streptomyces stelliscabiei]MDX2659261.1 superoxide dismutase family protein [Streptomyces stelliscabiei]MDX2716254.1 superoxide dismutase family protein [Streptomyces stelliscabiei]